MTRGSCTTYRVAVHIVVLNWRDSANPEGGGSEVYVEHLAQHWARSGHSVTLVCAAHDRAPAFEVRGSMRIVRIGTKLTVYSRARRLLREGHLGRIDVVIDTQNGVPFFAARATDAPTVVLVHHIHREQWPIVYGPVRSRMGWWIESSLAPWFYRGHDYVTVSAATRDDLIRHGVDSQAITIVHNGIHALPPTEATKETHPRILVLGRLVPHKRVEHVIAAAARLRPHHPGLSVAVVGDGWWSQELLDEARRWGVQDIVEFTGHIDEAEKARQIARAWVLALPSVKEGWGLVVMEAASLGVPAVAYASAGGVGESIIDGVTGRLVDGDADAFTRALDDLLSDESLRDSMGAQAKQRSHDYSWEESASRFEIVLQRAVTRSAVQRRRTSWIRRQRKAGRP